MAVDRDLVGAARQPPAFKTSGLNFWSPCGSTLNTRFGAPPFEIVLPSRPTSFV